MMNSIFTLPELKEKYTALQRLLTQVQEDHAHMVKALDYLERMPSNPVPGDIAGQAKATAAMEIVRSREETNRKLIALYDKMYEDLRSVMFQQELPSSGVADTTKE